MSPDEPKEETPKYDDIELEYMRAIKRAELTGETDLAAYHATGLAEYRAHFKSIL